MPAKKVRTPPVPRHASMRPGIRPRVGARFGYRVGMADQNDHLLYVSCFTGDSTNLQAFGMDRQTGRLSARAGTSAGLAGPLYVASTASGRFLYLADYVKECDGERGGAICAFAIDRGTGKPIYLNRKPARGEVPCYVSVTRDGRFALVANYGDGSVSVLPIGSDGRLGDAVQRIAHDPATVGEDARTKRNAHSIILSADQRFAFAADLGLDAIMVYRFDAVSGQLTPSDPPFVRTAKKAGPRHLAFHPNNGFLYAMTEYDNTVIVMAYDAAKGTLRIIEALPALPAGFEAKSYGSDIHLHPGGRFLYAANRGHDSIAMFQVDPDHGTLTSLGHESTRGQFPRGFAIDPDGRFLLVGNEKSDAVVTFAIDQQTGRLAATGDVTHVSKPSGLCFV